MTHVSGIDYAVLGLYFAFVLGIGVLRRRSVMVTVARRARRIRGS